MTDGRRESETLYWLQRLLPSSSYLIQSKPKLQLTLYMLSEEQPCKELSTAQQSM